MEEKYYKQLGHTIRAIRRSKDLSQEYMALKLNISQNMYSKIEAGKCKCSIYRFVTIMELLGKRVTDVEALQVFLDEKHTL